MKKTLAKILLFLFCLILLMTMAILIWSRSPFSLMAEVEKAMASDAKVLVENHNKWILFKPKKPTDTALIIYPGTRVNVKAYSPTARQIAAKGFQVFLVKMPLNLSVLGINRANQVIRSFPEIKKWAITGHSMGGSMAAYYVEKHPQQIEGLLFWASYPGQGIDLTGSPHLKVMSLYGELDGLATPQDIEDHKSDLPQHTIYVEIKGGNHAQFGWYGEQKRDHPAKITYTEQQKIIVEKTIEFLNSL
ncbi:MAG: alpha/beta hydrolase [Spirochaetes bacterium]|nr:alpha/beta hydrolase [Spirochaetota bacterium]